MKKKIMRFILLLVIFQLIFILTACDSDMGPYVLNVKTSGAGRVIVSPDKPIYQKYDRVYLKPVPYDSSYDFAYWEGSYNSNHPWPVIVMDSDKYIKANFGWRWLFDEFTYDDDTWYTGSFENSYLEINYDKYIISIYNRQYYLGSIPGGVIPSGYTGDFYGEVEFKYGTPRSSGGAGFVFNNIPEKGIKYYLTFDTDGSYIIEKEIDDGWHNRWETIRRQDYTPYFNKYGINKIGFRKNGNIYSFYLNGHFLTDIYIRDIKANLGVAACCRDYNNPLIVEFDNFKILLLDEGTLWTNSLEQDSKPVLLHNRKEP